MLLTVLWATACLVLSFLLGRHPMFLLGLSIAAYALVPSVVNQDITAVLTPGDYLLGCVILIQLLFHPRRMLRALGAHPVLTIMVAVAALFSVVARSAGLGAVRSAVVTVGETLVLPYLAFILAVSALHRNPRAARPFLWVLALLSIGELVLAYQQYQRQDAIVWTDAFANQWWWDENFVLTQPVGTFGHWIPLAVFLAIALGLTTLLRNRLLWFSLILGTIYVLTLTAARSGLLALAIVGVAIIGRELSLRSPGRLLLTIMSVPVIAVVAIGFLTSEAATTLNAKLEDDGYSTTYRVEAAQWFWSNWHRFFLTGLPDGEADLRSSGVLSSSLENGFYMYAVAFGMISAVLLLLVMLGVLISTVRNGGAARLTGVMVGLAYLASTFSYGSFGARELSTLLIFWIAQAIAQAPKPDTARPSSTAEISTTASSSSAATRLATSVPRR